MQEGFEYKSILHEVVVGGLRSRRSKVFGAWMAGNDGGGRPIKRKEKDLWRFRCAHRGRSASGRAALEEEEGREEEES